MFYTYGFSLNFRAKEDSHVLYYATNKLLMVKLKHLPSKAQFDILTFIFIASSKCKMSKSLTTRLLNHDRFIIFNTIYWMKFNRWKKVCKMRIN